MEEASKVPGKRKVLRGNRKRGGELAVEAADEEDVRKRQAVEAFLGAIPWHFAKEIRLKKIENLKEALEEAKTRKTIEEEEEGRKKEFHAAVEEGDVARQGRNMAPRREKRARGDPICWGCGEKGHNHVEGMSFVAGIPEG